MTEEEILSILAGIKSGKKDSFDSLVGAYAPLIESCVAATAPKIASVRGTSVGDVSEDLSQEARLALYRAALSYDADGDGKSVTFGLYAKVCVRNAMISEVRRESAARRRHARAESDLSAVAAPGNGSEKEALRELIEKSRGCLTDYEAAVLDRFLSGMPAREIAREMGKTPKSVSNAIFRLKAKLRRETK